MPPSRLPRLVELFEQGGTFAWAISVLISVALAMMITGLLNSFWTWLQRLPPRRYQIVTKLTGIALSRTNRWIVFILLLNLLIRQFETRETLESFKYLVSFATLWQIGVWGFAILQYWRQNYLERRAAQDLSVGAAIGLLYTAIQTIFVIMLILIGLRGFGVDIAGLLTGLGIGGIAIALAAQNILGDLLSSLSIVLDKPFVLGDFIVVGQEMGTVEHIGVKTTRVRSLSGEQLIFSNKDLLESRIRNYKRMSERRVVVRFNISMRSSIDLLDRIPNWVRGEIEKTQRVRFDRCHLAEIGASFYIYELVFFVLNDDFNLYMDIQQDLYLRLLKKFDQEGVEIAIPAQKLFFEDETPAREDLRSTSASA